ncbi:MAG: 3'(2'),5'-bisphosphate nucleotidase CysQ [Alphaproteobacteria bacterium]
MGKFLIPNNLKEMAVEAIFQAGEIALKLKEKLVINYKSPNQPVTNADKQIDNFLFNFFKTNTPDYGWLSEESIDNNSRFKNDFFWCLDPIDGTRSYIMGKPEYTISLALIKNSSPVMGIIYNPETKDLFFAEKGKGAYCNKKNIFVNKKKNIDTCSVVISSSEEKKLKSYNFFTDKEIITIGSIAYKIVLVAKGDIDIALSLTKKNDWDLAAADLIIKEAGGLIYQTNGKKIVYNTDKLHINSVMASNSIILPELKRNLRE